MSSSVRKLGHYLVGTMLAIALLCQSASVVNASHPQCATLGKKYVIVGKTYTCVRSGNKLVLKKVLATESKITTTTSVAVSIATTALPTTTTVPKTTTTSKPKLVVGEIDPTTGGTIIADAGVGKTISVGKTNGRYVVVVPMSCEYKSTWSSKVKNGYSCGGKSDWEVPTLSMYFNFIFPVVDPPPGTFWTNENGTETNVPGVYGGMLISNVTGRGVKSCQDMYSCSGGAAKYNVVQVLPVRAYSP